MLNNQGDYKDMFHRFDFNATDDLTGLNGSDMDYIKGLGEQLLKVKRSDIEKVVRSLVDQKYGILF